MIEPTVPADVSATRRASRPLLALLLAAIVVAVFARGLDNDLVGDDLEWVRFALAVRGEFLRIFSLFSGFVTPAMNATVGVDALIGGTAPWIYNLTGLLFHLANVMMILRLLRAALGRSGAAAAGAAWWAAAWWGLHYRHDEAVFWLGGRPHVLVVTGVLAALLAQRRWLRRGRTGSLVACWGAGAFAILSKESGVIVAALAALWLVLIEREPLGPFRPRRWTPVLGLAAAAAAHGLLLWTIRAEHQFYYRLDASWVGRLGSLLLQPAAIPSPDPAPGWLILPAAAGAAVLLAFGSGAVRFGVLALILGTLPTMLIEHQPPRYRYLPLAGAAFVLAAILRPLLARARWPAAAAMAAVCAYLAIGVYNDEAYLDEAGRIHRALRDAFCEAARGHDPSSPLLVVWTPALQGVEALKVAANRRVTLEVRNFPPIFVRAEGIEGLAAPETLYALCEGGSLAPDAVRLGEAEAGSVAARGAPAGILYEAGRFQRIDGEGLANTAAFSRAEGRLPRVLPDGRRAAILAVPAW